MPLILQILLILFALLLIAVAVFTVINIRAMNRTVTSVMALLGERCGITQLPAGAFEKLSLYGVMRFRPRLYEVKGIGSLSVMTMNIGLMQMASIILTPVEKDLPLLSIDLMYMLAKRIELLEIYDVMIGDHAPAPVWTGRFRQVFGSYPSLKTETPKEAWYSHLLLAFTHANGMVKDDAALSGQLVNTVQVWLDEADSVSALPADRVLDKLAAVEQYTHRLVREGGISTNMFKSALGDEKTAAFFDEVFFGTARYHDRLSH